MYTICIDTTPNTHLILAMSAIKTKSLSNSKFSDPLYVKFSLLYTNEDGFFDGVIDMSDSMELTETIAMRIITDIAMGNSPVYTDIDLNILQCRTKIIDDANLHLRCLNLLKTLVSFSLDIDDKELNTFDLAKERQEYVNIKKVIYLIFKENYIDRLLKKPDYNRRISKAYNKFINKLISLQQDFIRGLTDDESKYIIVQKRIDSKKSQTLGKISKTNELQDKYNNLVIDLQKLDDRSDLQDNEWQNKYNKIIIDLKKLQDDCSDLQTKLSKSKSYINYQTKKIKNLSEQSDIVNTIQTSSQEIMRHQSQEIAKIYKSQSDCIYPLLNEIRQLRDERNKLVATTNTLQTDWNLNTDTTNTNSSIW